LILVFLEERFRPIHLLLEIWYMPYQQKIYIRLAGPVTDLAPRSPLCNFHIKLSLDEPQLDLRFVYTSSTLAIWSLSIAITACTPLHIDQAQPLSSRHSELAAIRRLTDDRFQSRLIRLEHCHPLLLGLPCHLVVLFQISRACLLKHR
jgi:hypothetical protein